MITTDISEASLKVFRAGLSRFASFSEAEWAELLPYLKAMRLKKKEHFSVQGAICKYIGFIITGSVRYYHVKDGLEITGYFSFENEFVSSYKSYVTQQPAAGYIQALEQTELIVISHKNMQLMLSHPTLAFKMERFGRLVAEYYICCYEDRIASFITQTPEERYMQMLEKQGDILLRVPQHYVANFLGITSVSLSRIRKRTLLIC